MRRITFVHDNFVISRVLADRTLDRRVNFVFGHVDGARVLNHAAQRRIVRGIWPTTAHRDGDVFTDAGKLFRHAIPTGEHDVLAGFEDASHEL